jgi:phosphatidylinositol-binding clathrin assembly protein
MVVNYKNYKLTEYGRQVQTQGRNIRHYANYLTERAKAYRDTKCDYVREAEHRFEKLTIDKGLLRETEIVQQQIERLLKCDVSR